MLQSYLGTLYYSLRTAAIIEGRLRTVSVSRTPEQTAELRDAASRILTQLKAEAATLGLSDSVRYIGRVTPIPNFRTEQEIAWLIESTIKVVENEADQRFCYTVKKNKSDLYELERERWRSIVGKFPSVGAEANSALICYAIDENTACVFHLMRIAEIGLRALARERQVTIPKKPLAWAEWNDILIFLQKKIDRIGERKRGPTKDAALAFYQGSIGEFGAFKDTYRNIVMHVRKSYDEHEAASALLHVREFMGRLSAKLGENDTKAIKWGRF